MKTTSLTLIGAIAVGAIAGALLRFWLQRYLNLSAFSPIGTFLVNMGGSFILGLVTGYFAYKHFSPLFYGISAGFCGSFTTFSSISMEIFTLFRLHNPIRGAMYGLITAIGGLIAVAVGYALGHSWGKF